MQCQQDPSGTDLEFWRLKIVEGRAGLSKTEIYRRMKDTDPQLNPFPPSRPYRGSGGRGAAVFWVSEDVRAWQAAEIGVAPPPFPHWPSNSMRVRARSLEQQGGDPMGLLG